ncbi:MAG: glycosyltransferase family 2 protein [Chitinophagaceae bacterium]
MEQSSDTNCNSVSVALAVYNGEKYLPQQLASLQSQTLKPCELVVLDDCSTDRSVEIINAFQFPFDKKNFSNEKNMGPVYTFKKLAALCQGNFIAFCDQDDIWLPTKLELSLCAIKKFDNNIPAVVFSDLSIINEHDTLVQNSFWKQMAIKPNLFSLTDILFGNIITGCTALINRAMAIELSKMPLNIMMHDHWIALIAYSFGKYFYIQEPTVLYRMHHQSVTSKEKHSLFKVFSNDFKNKSIYLEENIQQATEFKKMYLSKLKKENIKQLNEFINLKQKPFLQKRLSRYRRSLMRKFKSIFLYLLKKFI